LQLQMTNRGSTVAIAAGSVGDRRRRRAAAPSAIFAAPICSAMREVVIEHEHHRYRLKMTSRGGLILNK
jgi:hypothetical protein